mmetsp:Transcript_30148/g.53020  ORF Transcript_30148/g.53020 Transcript_30148/m.53020 type:complete len:242 (-) Transcript_30148:141-866(-)
MLANGGDRVAVRTHCSHIALAADSNEGRTSTIAVSSYAFEAKRSIGRVESHANHGVFGGLHDVLRSPNFPVAVELLVTHVGDSGQTGSYDGDSAVLLAPESLLVDRAGLDGRQACCEVNECDVLVRNVLLPPVDAVVGLEPARMQEDILHLRRFPVNVDALADELGWTLSEAVGSAHRPTRGDHSGSTAACTVLQCPVFRVIREGTAMAGLPLIKCLGRNVMSGHYAQGQHRHRDGHEQPK